MLKINPGQPKLWLRPDTIQIGLDAKSVIVGGLSPAHQRFIRALQSGIADAQVNAIARASRLTTNEAHNLLERISPALLEPAPAKTKAKNSSSALALLRGGQSDFAELIRFALATNIDGAAALAQRAGRVIHIESLNRTGITLMRGLATAGFAQFWSGDRNKVAADDVTGVGFEKSHLGLSRFEAASKIADSFADRTALLDVSELRPRVLDKVDCAVLLGTVAIEPKRYERWMRLGVPHVAATFNHLGVQVSPLITPRKTACLSCHELAMAEATPERTMLVMQSFKSQQKYDDASSTLFAGAVLTAAIAEAMDSLGGFEHRNFERVGWFFERSTGRIYQLEWPTMADCGCLRDVGPAEVSQES